MSVRLIQVIFEKGYQNLYDLDKDILEQAVIMGHIDVIKKCNLTNERCLPITSAMLISLSNSNNMEIFKFLLDNAKNINYKILAKNLVAYNLINMFSYIMKYLQQDDKNSLLINVITGEWDISFFNILIDEGVDIYNRDILSVAITKNNKVIINRLFELNVDVKKCEKALHNAIINNDKELIRILLDKGSIIRDECMYLATGTNDIETIKMLETEDTDFKSLFPYAVNSCKFEMVKYFVLDKKVNVSECDISYLPRCCEMMMFLVNNGMKVTPQAWQVALYDTENTSINFLINKGEKMENELLIEASLIWNSEDKMKIILKHIDVNTFNDRPLLYALRLLNIGNAEVLLDHGIKIINDEIIQLAATLSMPEFMMNKLIKQGANIYAVKEIDPNNGIRNRLMIVREIKRKCFNIKRKLDMKRLTRWRNEWQLCNDINRLKELAEICNIYGNRKMELKVALAKHMESIKYEHVSINIANLHLIELSKFPSSVLIRDNDYLFTPNEIMELNNNPYTKTKWENKNIKEEAKDKLEEYNKWMTILNVHDMKCNIDRYWNR